MLNYVEKGQGPAILFIHAFPLDHSMWQPQVEFFANRYRVIAIDLPGFGGSQPARSWTIQGMGDELLSVLDGAGVERCTIVGLSIGGYIALPFAVKQPQRVEKLVLAHTRARADTDVERNNRTQMIQSLQQSGIGLLPERMLPRLLAPTASVKIREQVSRTILTASADAAIFAVTAMRDRSDATSVLKEVAQPTLVIAGADDAILKVEDCRQMAEAIPHNAFTVIANAGHLSNLENTQAFNHALDQFLLA